MEPTEAAPEEKEAAQLPYCRQQVLLLLLILVAPVPAGDSRAIWRSQKPAALAAHSRHPLPTQHHYKHSTLYLYTHFPPPASTATVGAATLTLGGKQERKHIGRQTKKKKRESKQEKKRNFVVVMSRQKPRTGRTPQGCGNARCARITSGAKRAPSSACGRCANNESNQGSFGAHIRRFMAHR